MILRLSRAIKQTSRPSRRTRNKRALTRRITEKTKILLAVASGGRCQFPGCNEYLLEHPLTLQGGNFSEHAHIVPFSERGPRSQGRRPADINSMENLLLLCAQCHKLIDDREEEYPRQILEKYKREHEERIRFVTGLSPDAKTTVVQLKACIGGQAVDIPATHVIEAISPRFPADNKGYIIDLTQFGHETSSNYYGLATREIDLKVADIYRSGMSVENTRHISLFALAPIPLLIFLGSRLSNKINVDFFQRHRDSNHPWTWQTAGERARFTVDKIRNGNKGTRVALLLSLSGTVDPAKLPNTIDGSFNIYEMTLTNRRRGVDFLKHRDDLESFRSAYRALISDLHAQHPGMEQIHLFPAVPAPVAICCGYDLLPKVHAALVIYDNDKHQGGFINRLTVNRHGIQ